MRILVVEDDRKVAGFIEMGLREEGYAVDVAKDGEEATVFAHINDYDAILLDLMLPKKNGLQVASELRREGRSTPILMLTARDATEDVVRGLDAGADDYLTKPFKFDELLARLRALVRRGGAARLDRLSYGPLELDRLKHKAWAGETSLDLTPREFQLLEHFMLHPEDVVRRTELLEKVWDMHFDPESNVVDVHVGNLRRKLRDAGFDGLIQTVRGVGFCLKQNSPEPRRGCATRARRPGGAPADRDPAGTGRLGQLRAPRESFRRDPQRRRACRRDKHGDRSRDPA
jgi:DNA-binding response OmpR family regulator